MYRKEKQNRCSLNLDGYVTHNGVGELFCFKKKATAMDYKKNLNDLVLPSIRAQLNNEFVLVQDNAPTHANDLVHDYLKNQNVKLLIWPAKSPQFNLIENCWAEMQKKVNQLIHYYGQPKRELLLYWYASVAWKSISKKYVQSLYESLPNRINDYLLNGV